MAQGEENQGLARAKALYQNRSQRARQLRAQGKRVLGYLCAYPVLEMMTALELVPYRILGDIEEPITRADACLPTVVCPFLRSALDMGLKKKYDFFDGVVMAHSCDVAEKTAHIWNTYLRPPYFHFIDTPHTVHPATLKRHKELIKGFKETLESFAGKELPPEKLRQAIGDHNRQRSLVRELYDLRKPNPPLISGSETLKVLVALMSLPVEEGNKLLGQVINEIKERQGGPKKKPARLLVWGSIIDSTALIDMMEQLEANLVMDDTCIGSRFYWPDVEPTRDPLDGLAYRYLVALKCPRTFRCWPTFRGTVSNGAGKDYQKDLDSRFGYLNDYIKEWNIDGVVLQSIRYCDIHGYEVPAVKDYLSSIGLPSIYLEYDYSPAALAQLKTRVQAFLELIV